MTRDDHPAFGHRRVLHLPGGNGGLSCRCMPPRTTRRSTIVNCRQPPLPAGRWDGSRLSSANFYGLGIPPWRRDPAPPNHAGTSLQVPCAGFDTPRCRIRTPGSSGGQLMQRIWRNRTLAVHAIFALVTTLLVALDIVAAAVALASPELISAQVAFFDP